MTRQSAGDRYFGSDEGRFASTQDEARVRGESSPPALTDESGAPRFAKGPSAARGLAPRRRGGDQEPGTPSGSPAAGEGAGRGTPPPAAPG